MIRYVAPALLLAYLLPVLLAIAVLTPPWQNPDEPFHMLRAVQIAHGELLARRAWGSAGGDTDPAIYEAYLPLLKVAMHPANRISLPALAASGAARWHGHTEYAHFPNTAQYGPVFYVPDAIAYWLGRAARLSVDHTLLLARAIQSALFALTATASLCIARRARLPLAAVILLPTTLSLAASASHDCEIFAATALCVAILDRAIAEQRAATRWEFWLLAGLLACIGMARPPYATFLLVMWLAAPGWRSVSPVLPVLAGVAIAAWSAFVALHVAIHFGGADIGRQLALLRADPGRIPHIAMATLRTFGVEYGVQFIGVLGWTDTRLPRAYILFAGVMFVLAALAGTQGPSRRPWLPVSAAVLATLIIFILQYLTWTWPGQPVVTSVLGRYFQPIVMVLLLALPRARLRLGFLPAGAIAALAAVTPAVMLHAVLVRYYLTP